MTMSQSKGRTYIGVHVKNGVLVSGGGATITPKRSQRLVNHSPTGFAWGYAGSGPAQLSLALLLEETNDDKLSLLLYQDFKHEVVAGWPWNLNWVCTSDKIQTWIRDKQRQGIVTTPFGPFKDGAEVTARIAYRTWSNQSSVKTEHKAVRGIVRPSGIVAQGETYSWEHVERLER